MDYLELIYHTVRSQESEWERKDRFYGIVRKEQNIGEKTLLQGVPFTKDFSFHKKLILNLQNDKDLPLSYPSSPIF